MEFTDFYFLTAFLPLVMAVRCFLSYSYRNPILIALSFCFYAYGNWQAVPVLLILTLVNYYCAFRRNTQLVANVLNLFTLMSFKYIHDLFFPLGVSFYVFQLISYQMDVRRNVVEPEVVFPRFLLYVSFFPKMVVGPIARYSSFPEDYNNQELDWDNVVWGLEHFCIGLTKKVMFADGVARIADCIFDSPVETVPTPYCWLGAIAYSVQIYYDFSGCTDMAIGIARMLGFRMPENFDYPYSSKSIQEFWRRWHMSLSFWFRDYLYIPLGGNRKGKVREYLNMLVVFLLCGAWHGATWTFVIWGGYHGLGITLEKLGLKKLLKKLPIVVSNLYLLLFVMIGWVLFRSESMSQSIVFLRSMFIGNSNYPYYTFKTFYHVLDFKGFLMILFGMILSYPVTKKIYNSFSRRIRLVVAFILFLMSFFTAITADVSPSIYGKF